MLPQPFRPLRRSYRWVAILALVLLTAAGCTSGSAAAPKASPPASRTTSAMSAAPRPPAGGSGDAQSLQSDFVSVVHAVLPSVVLIRTSRDLGSGIVYDTEGDIVTNDHVVGSARTFRVSFAGSAATLPAKLVGTYPPDDLAVVRVSGAKNLHPARFANSRSVQVGDIVLALGNPLGLASSVTEGIVSAVGRTVSEPTGEGSPGATLPDVIQTSAAINPGNSGGALVDLAGEVVGIPTLAATDQQLGGGAAPGIGFAISSDTVTSIASQLVKDGKVINSHRAALGITAATVAGSGGSAAGVGIYEVAAGGAAAKAGLKPGEIILAVDGTTTQTEQELATVLANLSPGQTVTVKVLLADGSRTTVRLTLGSLPG